MLPVESFREVVGLLMVSCCHLVLNAKDLAHAVTDLRSKLCPSVRGD
jgi:hypothetical protein